MKVLFVIEAVGQVGRDVPAQHHLIHCKNGYNLIGPCGALWFQWPLQNQARTREPEPTEINKETLVSAGSGPRRMFLYRAKWLEFCGPVEPKRLPSYAYICRHNCKTVLLLVWIYKLPNGISRSKSFTYSFPTASLSLKGNCLTKSKCWLNVICIAGYF